MSLLDKASLLITPNGVKSGKLYSVIPNTTLGDMNVVRATTATRVNSLGLIEIVGLNVPRLDYSSDINPSILVEPQRTNFILRSDNFDDAYWIKGGVTIIANDTIAPDGNTNAENLKSNGNSGDEFIERNGLPNTVGTYTSSVFVKNINSTQSTLTAVHSGEGSIVSEMNYNWATGIVTISGTNAVLGKAKNYGNGWYRLEFTFTIGALVTNHSLRIYSQKGLTTKSIFIYGAQLEQGSFATSYIPTVASTVTRNADVISKTGISSLIGQTEGAFFIDFSLINTSSNQDFLRTNFLDFNNTIVFRKTSLNELSVFLRISNVTIFVFSFANLPIISKVCLIYKSGSSSLFINGVKTNTSTITFTISIPFFDLILGAFNDTGTNHSNIKINSVQLYKTALTDAECIQLTTL